MSASNPRISLKPPRGAGHHVAFQTNNDIRNGLRVLEEIKIFKIPTEGLPFALVWLDFRNIISRRVLAVKRAHSSYLHDGFTQGA